MIQELLREDRLIFWDRLIQWEIVELKELDQLITKLAHDASAEEKASSVLLLAAALVARVERRAMRRNLVAALRYWFSHVGTKDRPPQLKECEDFYRLNSGGLLDFMGLYLSWSEAMCSVGANPNDYSALKRLEKRLKQAYEKEWERLFGSSVPPIITHGR